ncbi:hypothetical protein [Streptomyces synnematoformans]|uniref:Uncharacterized protein n=1 Tax=Streptomyces synnematoformans TaxID=415721 RepID=A0ABN2XTL7_9ACTN
MTTADGKIREATAAHAELSAALRKAGVSFPAMDVKPQGVKDGKPSYGMVELGTVSPPVAKWLAHLIARGAET